MILRPVYTGYLSILRTYDFRCVFRYYYGVKANTDMISPIFFEVGIPNLMCGCILGWQSVAYHFWITVTLTSDLVFRKIVSGAYLFI